jgi:DNA-binding response OmpR family regulator
METRRREQIQRSLCSLAESYRATMDLMEQTLAMLCEELSLDPASYSQAHSGRQPAQTTQPDVTVDPATLTVSFRGKSCFLGNSLPFRLLRRLARRPDTYVTYEELLSDVWEGSRSEDAVRSVVKTLRKRLRVAGMAELADAVDGSVPGHYAVKLPR